MKKMKICGIICEYNPFHNGHAYLIEKAKRESGCDAVMCIMSGNFTQRGEPSVLDKYTRARHAIEGGADAVVELPTVFAVSPAELFAKGAVKLLSSVPAFSLLAFGCESGDSESFLKTARALSNESNEIKAGIRAKLKSGMSLIRARHEAATNSKNPELSPALLSSPNNVLGIEYQKALLYFESPARILPVLRQGGAHADKELRNSFSSATAIRAAAKNGRLRAVRKNVPPDVFQDLKNMPDLSDYKKIAVYAALSRSAEELKRIMDCTEGLENRIKALAKGNPNYDELIAKITTKRYISSRIRRILAAAVLQIDGELVRKSLKNKLYLNVLAIKKGSADELLPELCKSDFPVLLRRSDEKQLSARAKECYEKDMLAEDIYNFLAKKTLRGGKTLFL